MSDRSIQQHAICTEFHRNRHVAGRSDTSVNDDWIVWISARRRIFEKFENDRDCTRIGNTATRSDGTSCGHHTCCACIAQSHGHNWIIAGITQNLESICDQLAACFERSNWIGQQSSLIAEDFQLDPARARIFHLLQNVTA